MGWKINWSTRNKETGVDASYVEHKQYNADVLNLLEKEILPIAHSEEEELIDIYIETEMKNHA